MFSLYGVLVAKVESDGRLRLRGNIEGWGIWLNGGASVCPGVCGVQPPVPDLKVSLTQHHQKQVSQVFEADLNHSPMR